MTLKYDIYTLTSFNQIWAFSFDKRKYVQLKMQHHKVIDTNSYILMTPESYEKIWKEHFLLSGIHSLV